MSPATVLLILRVLMAVLLYAFLAFILWGLWRDVQAVAARVGEAPAAHLLLLAGPEEGEQLPLQQTTEIGRVVGNAVRLQDETVSARHARISFRGGQWWLEDLASRNGTEVNGLPVEEPLVVTYGDELQFGRVQVRLEEGPVQAHGEGEAFAERTVPLARADG